MAAQTALLGLADQNENAATKTMWLQLVWLAAHFRQTPVFFLRSRNVISVTDDHFFVIAPTLF